VRANANRCLAYPVLLRRPNMLLLADGIVWIAVQVVIPLAPTSS